MLGAYEYRFDPHGAVTLVADRNLALAVGPKVVEVAALADLGQPARQGVCERDGHRHQFVRLPAGKAEHHPLVARADLLDLSLGHLGASAGLRVRGMVDALGDIRRLGVYRDYDAAGLGVEAELGSCVADLRDLLAH